MAIDLQKNPTIIQETGTIVLDKTEIRKMLLLQWVNDEGDDMADTSNLQMTINGQQFTVDVQDASAAGGPVVYQVGPFTDGFYVHQLVIDALTHGAVLIWWG